MSGRTTYPQDWFLKPLGEVCRVEIGGTPSRNVPRFWASEGQKGYPWVAISDLGSKWIHKTAECITGAGVNNSNVKLVPRGTVLMSFKLTLGRVGLAGVDLYTNEAIAAFFPDYSHVSDDWLYHVLPTIAETGSAEQAIKGQTLNKDKIQRLILHLPSLPEQRRIAEILDAADEAVHQTEVVITKLKALKAGLLHDLLTRGLDEHGRLRDPEAHPEQFQDSVLGRIPREWEITTLGSVIAGSGGLIQTGPFGSQLHAEEYTDEGIPVIMPQDIQEGQVSEEQIARIPLNKVRSLARHQVLPNDVVFARRGDLSRCASITEREAGWLCGTGCLLVRLPQKTIAGQWLVAIYQHDIGQRQILAKAVGSTMVNLNTPLLGSLVVARPLYDEQVAIVETFEAHDARIRAEETTLAKLRQVKRGLMEDLLTGRVWVPGSAHGSALGAL